MKKQRDIFSIRQKKNPAIFTYCDIIIRKLIDLKYQEKFSKASPYDKITY